MGWKRIGNHEYYYRSVREGDRVRSEYLGRGESASLIALMEASEREERFAAREAERGERERWTEAEREFVEWFDRVEALARVALVLAGCHRHKGEWRRRRDVRGDGPDRGGGRNDGRGRCPDSCQADLG